LSLSPGDARQPPIGEYALLGDTRTAALVSRAGSIDWLCLPRFDADPVFGTLIDSEHGGRFDVSIEGQVESRRYREDSVVLETLWRGPDGTALMTEVMPVGVSGFRPQLSLVRHLRCTSGEVRDRVLFDQRLGLPGRRLRYGRRGEAIMCEWGSMALVLQSFPGPPPEPGKARSVELSLGESLTLIASMADRTAAVLLPAADGLSMIQEAHDEWRRWCAEIDYEGAFRSSVVRSLITLRQLTYSPSGAPIAAPTMALPERLGGDLNWDYRYAWPRDAGIGSGAFMAAGKSDEAKAFLRWLEIASRLTRPRMRVLYTLDGTAGHREREIEGVSGYRDSLPVHAANGASDQHQLDVYGWIVDSAWHLASLGTPPDGPSWRMVRSAADFVAGCWREPDSGIWESRGPTRQHVSSKLLAFVALDRAARMAQAQRRDAGRAIRWRHEREELRAQVRREGWSDDLGCYTAHYGSRELDASVLLLAMSELEDEHPDRISSTMDRVRERLAAGGPLLYRHLAPGGGAPGEGAFLPCTFWLVDALARCGRVDEAEQLLGDGIRLGGELGLLAEEMDPNGREMLGNHPQALSHSALVAAALSIEAAKDEGRRPGSRRRRRAPGA